MSSFPNFANAVSRYKIKKLDDLVPEEKVVVRINPNGYQSNKVFQYALSLRPLFQDILTRLPLTLSGAQPKIGEANAKILALSPFLQKAIETVDKNSPKELKCMDYFKRSADVVSQIQQYVPYLSDSKAPTMSKYIDNLTTSIASVVEFYDNITANMLKYDEAIKSKLKSLSQAQYPVALCVAASLSACEIFFADLVFLSSNAKFKDSKDAQKQFSNWTTKLRSFADQIFEKVHAENNDLLAASQSVSARLPQIAAFLNQIQPVVKDCNQFSRTCYSLITFQQALKDLESKLQIKTLTDLMKNVSAAYLNKKPMDSMIVSARNILAGHAERISGGEQSGISKGTRAAIGVLNAMLNSCATSSEIAALTLISACRFAAIQFADAKIAEDLLVSLTQKISIITKSIFKEAKEYVLEIGKVMLDNLECFSEKTLAEVNYFYTAGKSLSDFNPDSDDFVMMQQLFFDVLCAIPTPTMKLIAACTEQSIKNQLSEIIKKIQPLANRFAKWLAQYYTTLTSIVHCRAESALAVLAYPLKCLAGTSPQIDSALIRVQATVNALSSILKTTPQYLTFDFAEILKLIGLLQDLADSGNDYIKIVMQQAGNPMYILLHIAAQTLYKIGGPLPISVQAIPSLLNFEEDNAAFVGGMLSNLSRALALAREAEPSVGAGDATSAFYFSFPFSFILTADAMIAASGSKGTTLVQYSAPLRSSIDVVWNISLAIAFGDNPQEASHLPTYAQSIIKTTSDLMNAACAMPQPMLRLNIPDNVKSIQKFDQLAASLPSALLKHFAPTVVKIMKKGNRSDVKDALSQWFETAKAAPTNLDKELDAFVKVAVKCAGTDKPDIKGFKAAFARLSTAMAMCENNYGKNIAPLVNDIHKKFVEMTTKYLDTSKPDPNAPMEMVAHVQQLKALPELAQLKQKDTDEFTNGTISSIIQGLHAIRSKGKDADTSDTVEGLRSLGQLDAFYSLYPMPSPLDTKTSEDLLIKGKPKKEALDASIKYFSDKLDALVPCMYRAVDRLRDSDAICALAYDKYDMFRDMSAKVCTIAGGKGSEAELNAAIASTLEALADVAILTFHTININGFRDTNLSREFADTYCDLQKEAVKFATDAQKVKKSKGDAGSIKNKQKEMVKELDKLVTIIENPQQEMEPPPGKFRQAQLNLYGQLGAVSTQMARIIELATTSLVPEMYSENRRQFQELMTYELDRAAKSGSLIAQKAVGDKGGEVTSNVDKLDKHAKKLIKDSNSLKIGVDPCPVLALLDDISDTAKDVEKLTSTVPKLTDTNVVGPDPDSAAKVPDDYVLPDPPSKIPTQAAAWEAMQEADKGFQKALIDFQKVNDNGSAKASELVSAIKSFRKAADGFGQAAIGMTVATPDLKARVGMQAALYAWGSNITNVQNAIRSRLLRVPGFEDEMAESLDFLNTSTMKVMRLSEEASKITASAEDDSMDEVSRQLMATAREVEALASKMNSYENKVNMSDVVADDGKKSKAKKGADTESDELPQIADPKNYDLLPAFLIACATIILRAASRTVNRAQEMTQAILDKFGRVENERGLIKSAVELSEAAKLLMIVADILIAGKDDEADYKVVAAARIIRGAVASLISCVLVKGGDSTGVMDKQLKIINRVTDHLIKVVMMIINYKLDEKDRNAPKKVTNPMIQRLNMQQQVNAQRKLLEEEERRLYAFRRERGMK